MNKIKHQKIKEKKCCFPGCEVVFSGIHVAKYCSEHKQSQYRVRKEVIFENVEVNNIIYEHENTTEIKQIELSCPLEACNSKFIVDIYPTQTIYPKFCPEHRNENKRQMHLKKLAHSKK